MVSVTRWSVRSTAVGLSFAVASLTVGAEQATPHQRWKLTGEDWRSREQWGRYELAVNDMIEWTSTRTAPWTIVEANYKYYARIKVLKTVCQRLTGALKQK